MTSTTVERCTTVTKCWALFTVNYYCWRTPEGQPPCHKSQQSNSSSYPCWQIGHQTYWLDPMAERTITIKENPPEEHIQSCRCTDKTCNVYLFFYARTICTATKWVEFHTLLWLLHNTFCQATVGLHLFCWLNWPMAKPRPQTRWANHSVQLTQYTRTFSASTSIEMHCS